MMKILKKVTMEGKVNHRNALFMAALCSKSDSGLFRVVFSVAIQNPDDKPNTHLAEVIATGRIEKAFNGLHEKPRLQKFAEIVIIRRSKSYLISKGVLHEMLKQFKRVKERDLAEKIGLKWKHKEGDVIKELSAEIKTDGPGITKLAYIDNSNAINTKREAEIGSSTSSKT